MAAKVHDGRTAVSRQGYPFLFRRRDFQVALHFHYVHVARPRQVDPLSDFEPVETAAPALKRDGPASLSRKDDFMRPLCLERAAVLRLAEVPAKLQHARAQNVIDTLVLVVVIIRVTPPCIEVPAYLHDVVVVHHDQCS